MFKAMNPPEAVRVGLASDAIYAKRVAILRRRLLPWFQPRIYNPVVLTTPGPLMVLMKHQSYADAPLAAALSERDLHALFKESGFRLMPNFFATGKAIPVRRGGGKHAAEVVYAVDSLYEAGGCLFLFPEQHRIKTDSVGPLKPGFLRYFKDGVRYVCVGATGTTDWRKGSRPVLYCSEVFDAFDFERSQRAAVLHLVKSQMDEVQRAAVLRY